MPALPASGYVVLGLLDRYGPATPYRLDQLIRTSIGYFWGFPRSQLYSEAERLVRHGLVAEEREADGRRRRSMTITDDGRDELLRWLGVPAAEPTEIRDVGLLQLFFAGGGDDPGAAVERLAARQGRAHQEQLQLYTELLSSGRVAEGSPQRATLEFGLRFEELALRFWAEIGSGAVSDTSAPPQPQP